MENSIQTKQKKNIENEQGANYSYSSPAPSIWLCAITFLVTFKIFVIKQSISHPPIWFPVSCVLCLSRIADCYPIASLWNIQMFPDAPRSLLWHVHLILTAAGERGTYLSNETLQVLKQLFLLKPRPSSGGKQEESCPCTEYAS